MARHHNSAHPEEDDPFSNGDSEVENSDVDGSVIDDTDKDDQDDQEDDEDQQDTIWVRFRKDVGKGSVDDIRNQVVRKYIDAVEYSNELRRDTVHKQITATKRKFLDDADEDEQLDEYEALRLAVSKRKYLIEQASGLESDAEETEDGDDEAEDEEDDNE